MPWVEVHHEAGTPCPHTPLGSRGLGEGIPGAVPGALTNAVCDALRPFGIEIDELPLRPDRVWRALKEAKQPAAAESTLVPINRGQPSRKPPFRTAIE